MSILHHPRIGWDRYFSYVHRYLAKCEKLDLTELSQVEKRFIIEKKTANEFHLCYS